MCKNVLYFIEWPMFPPLTFALVWKALWLAFGLVICSLRFELCRKYSTHIPKYSSGKIILLHLLFSQDLFFSVRAYSEIFHRVQRLQDLKEEIHEQLNCQNIYFLQTFILLCDKISVCFLFVENCTILLLSVFLFKKIEGRVYCDRDSGELPCQSPLLFSLLRSGIRYFKFVLL